MRIISKILIVMIIAFGVFAIVPQNIVRADGDAMGAIEKIENENVNGDDTATQKLARIAKSVVVFLQIGSGIAAVIMIAVTGFRYIIESPEVKAELKKNMLPIIVGILLVFFATSIARFFIGIFSNAQN